MIGKGRFFDLITRTVDDVNNPEITISGMLENYNKREEKYKKQIDKNKKEV